ncbi:hypothetical protein LWI28_027837 [Acer negundo]|uniref:Chromo domain-containing protein n=1 Tax=Acer negundo TaxID=4023 RepID=A0AAD5JJJ7_ACENE|nr:hypothetical protein LWI28_027837 [Acer negundo]
MSPVILTSSSLKRTNLSFQQKNKDIPVKTKEGEGLPITWSATPTRENGAWKMESEVAFFFRVFKPSFNIEDLTEFKGDEAEFSTTLAIEALKAPTLRVPTNTAPRDEIASILDHQFVTTRRGGYYKFLVQWKNRPNSKSVWLQATELRCLHPDLFAVHVRQYLPESSSSGEPTIDANQEAIP